MILCSIYVSLGGKNGAEVSKPSDLTATVHMRQVAAPGGDDYSTSTEAPNGMVLSTFLQSSYSGVIEGADKKSGRYAYLQVGFTPIMQPNLCASGYCNVYVQADRLEPARSAAIYCRRGMT